MEVKKTTSLYIQLLEVKRTVQGVLADQQLHREAMSWTLEHTESFQGGVESIMPIYRWRLRLLQWRALVKHYFGERRHAGQ